MTTCTPVYDRIAEIVASSGETINQIDSDDSVPNSPVSKDDLQHHGLMCKPIRNPDMEVIGQDISIEIF